MNLFLFHPLNRLSPTCARDGTKPYQSKSALTSTSTRFRPYSKPAARHSLANPAVCVGYTKRLTGWVCTTYYLAQSRNRLRIHSCAFRAKVETPKKQVSLCAKCWSLLSPVRIYYMGRPESFTGNAHVPIQLETERTFHRKWQLIGRRPEEATEPLTGPEMQVAILRMHLLEQVPVFRGVRQPKTPAYDPLRAPRR